MPMVLALVLIFGGLAGYQWGYEHAERDHHQGKRTCTTLPDKSIHCWSVIRTELPGE